MCVCGGGGGAVEHSYCFVEPWSCCVSVCIYHGVNVFAFNIPPTGKGIWRLSHIFTVSSNRLEEEGIEPGTLTLQDT